MSVIEKFIKYDENYKPKDKTSHEVMTEPEKNKKKHFIRSLGNVFSAAEAQRIFNPSLPPTKPKAPTAAQTELGTSSTMDIEGTWGQAERQDG